ELFLRLVAERRELRPDARLALHPRDIVAPGTAVLAGELLTRRDVGGISELGIQAGRSAVLRPERAQVRRDRARLVLGEAQARHARDRAVAPRVAYPVVDPPRVGLFGDLREVGCDVLVGAELPGHLVGAERVTRPAAERLDQLLAMRHLIGGTRDRDG